MTRMGEWAKPGDLVKADGEICEVVSGPWAAGGGGADYEMRTAPYVCCRPVWYDHAGIKRVPLGRVRIEKMTEEMVAEAVAGMRRGDG